MVLPFAPPGYTAEQGATSSTFTAPPLDGSLYLPEILDWHLERSATHPCTVLIGERDEENVVVTWAEFARAVHRLGAKLMEAIPNGRTSVEGKPQTVAILASVDALTYSTMMLALCRAGFEPFPLSSRNSEAALQHLLEATNCSYMIGSVPKPDCPPSFLEATTASLLSKVSGLKLLGIPSAADLYPRLALNPPPPYESDEDHRTTALLPPLRSLPSYVQADSRWPGIMLHSSGSTNFPKPIRIHHLALLGWLGAMWYGDVDVCGTVWASMGLPMFHVIGVFCGIFVPMACGSTPAQFKSAVPGKVPTPDNVLAATKLSGAQFLIAVPSFCEVWSEDAEAIKYLSTLKALIYGGGPMTQEGGDRLVEGGVNVRNGYASTETGVIFRLSTEGSLNAADWAYGELAPDLGTKLVHVDGKVHRLVLFEASHHGLAVWNVDGQMAYDTNDLVEEHPVHKGFWRLMGRSDDQIMMLNGEKTNPGPLEAIIAGHRAVRAALIFGRARNQVGVAIEPSRPVKIENDSDLEKFRNEIWPAVEKANEFAPSHSRIFKELILVVDPQKKPFIRVAKGTIVRNAALKQYETEIDALYEAAERPTKEDWAHPPAQWDEASIRAFVSRVVNGVIRSGLVHGSIDDDRDLFEQGCDSLQATYIRNAIVNALRQAPKRLSNSNQSSTTMVHQNLVFAHPTVLKLADYVAHISLEGSSGDDESSRQQEKISAMLAMVDKYSADLGEVVLLTGSTGALGTYILGALLSDSKVHKVYAMNRARQGFDILERQKQAFKDRCVDQGLLQSPKLRLIQADTTKPDFDLDMATLTEMSTSITAIIHNAWRVDFNLALPSFEPHLKATRNLVDLALSSPRSKPPKFIFTSSIATLSNWQNLEAVREERIDGPTIALGNGYGESKWVAERVILAAVEKRGLKATVWRIGQLAGSISNGAWTTTDWVPIIVRAGQLMGALPAIEGATVSWVPIDKAAEAIVDVLHISSEQDVRYLHLVHPKPVLWNSVFSTISSRLSIPLVPYLEWFANLERIVDGPVVERNPAIRLLEFLRIGVDKQKKQDKQKNLSEGNGAGTMYKEAMGVAWLETARAVEASRTLAALEPLDDGDVKRWAAYWEEHKLLD